MTYTAGELSVAGAIWNAIKWFGRSIHKIVTITRWIAWYIILGLLTFIALVAVFT